MQYVKRFVYLLFLSPAVLGLVVGPVLAQSSSTYQGRTATEWAGLLTDRSPAIRVAAAAALRRLGPDARPALPQLTVALGDSVAKVVEDAAWTLGFIGKDAAPAVSELVAVLGGTDHPARPAAAAALGLIGSAQPNVVPRLTTALRDADPKIRTAAALALGALGRDAEPSVSELGKLTKDEDPGVREAAVIALGRIGGGQSRLIVSLLRTLENDPSPNVRRNAAMARAKLERQSDAAVASVKPPTVPAATLPAGGNQSVRRNPEPAVARSQVPPTPVPAVVNRPPDEPSPATIKVVYQPVRILSHEKPRYTEPAARHGISGEVVLSVEFKADGRVGDVKIVKGLGYGLDESAVQVAKRLKFAPAVRDGQPVDAHTTIQYSFIQVN